MLRGNAVPDVTTYNVLIALAKRASTEVCPVVFEAMLRGSDVLDVVIYSAF